MEGIPVVEGYICRREGWLVIKKCPYCGLTHFHGWAKKYERVGTITRRESHCPTVRTMGGEYIIKIVGFMDDEECIALIKKKVEVNE